MIDVSLLMHKPGKPLSTRIQDWLVERLRRHEKIGSLIFRAGVALSMKHLMSHDLTESESHFMLSGSSEVFCDT